jgi:hypothetical protein
MNLLAIQIFDFPFNVNLAQLIILMQSPQPEFGGIMIFYFDIQDMQHRVDPVILSKFNKMLFFNPFKA